MEWGFVSRGRVYCGIAYLRKWIKRSRESVPLPSCLTNSCWTYCFHTSALEQMSMRTRGYGSFLVGLPTCDKSKILQRATSCCTCLCSTRGRSGCMWFSGPWPLPIGNAVAMPWCVYVVANLTASITVAACKRHIKK